MFYRIFRYELRYQFRLVSTHIYFGILFLLAFLSTLGAGGTFSGVSVHFSNSSDKVMVNSPYYLHSVITAFGYIGIIFVAAITARTINRDYENGTHQWFYTLPLKKGGFILGRLAGSFSVLVYIMSAVLIGTFLAAICPWVDPLKFAPNSFINYIYPFLTSTLPYLAFALTLLTAVSLWFRSTLNLMITAIMLIMTYAIMTEIKVPLEYKYLVALIDPFGMFTLDHVSKYWTIAEQNTKLIPFSGVFLFNRLISLAFAVVCFVAAYKKFSFSILTTSSKKLKEAEEKPAAGLRAPVPLIRKGTSAEIRKYFSLTYDNFKHILKSGPFIGLYAFWFVQTLINAKWMGEMYETTVLPVTSLVARRLYGNSVVFMLAIITI
ncbi:MAG TPA: ABC transporter permease subunit, partial [Clostridiales bacterium]|nr:ABC transporter permease subunit [Clostridiales bacterium]